MTNRQALEPIELVLAEYPDDVYAGYEQGEFADPAAIHHRGAAVVPLANEVGTWSLEYLGPGFHVQLRIARRNRQARVDGWMSPAQPIKVFLSSLLRQPVVLEAHVSESGRFEFPVAPSGACRMSFVTDRGRPPATPPFWI